jgi:diacylglycerol kinase (ATP)
MVPAILESGYKPRIGVLINPMSGKNRRTPGSLSRILNEYSEILQQKVQTPQDVYDALVEFSRLNVNILVISGGDGTVQAVLTVLFHHHPFASQPQLIVLEGGTTNMIAGDVGVPGNQAKALHRILQWMRSGSCGATRVQKPVLRLHVPGHEVKYGMFFGAAGISQGIQYYRKNLHNKKLRGYPGICMTLVRYFWGIIRQHSQSATSTNITVILDNQPPQKEDFMLLFVSTLDRLFFGLRPFWGTENGPLRFTAVRSGARYLLRVLPFLTRGRSGGKGTEENGYYSGNVHEIKLYITDSVALDGEIYSPASGLRPTSLRHGGDITFLRV